MAIVTHDLSFAAGGRTILAGTSLAFSDGRISAILGPSGSGKSTLLKCLVTAQRPSGGVIRVNGRDVNTVRESYRGDLGYVPQDDIIHRELRVEQALEFAARLRLDVDLESAQVRERIEKVMAQLGLSAQRGLRIRSLSGGQRKRVSIGVELLADPGVLMLDEPASGLDPGTETDLLQALAALAGRGKTIVLTTHSMECLTHVDFVVLLTEGVVAFAGALPEMLAHFEVDRAADVYTRLRDQTGAEWGTRFRASPHHHKATQPAPRPAKPSLPAPGAVPGTPRDGARNDSQENAQDDPQDDPQNATKTDAGEEQPAPDENKRDPVDPVDPAAFDELLSDL
jgi:ABC-type multidrug transport system ATPase subunit